MEQLEFELVQLLEELTPEVAPALVGYDVILAARSVANIFCFDISTLPASTLDSTGSDRDLTLCVRRSHCNAIAC
ncbi:hypothetical protein [Rubidibacter lacunae]|uniref:hypothetical protein n=1 Tax=Rubidibacter lacunae TaxID=582514 RepID=UPI0003F85E14|nr:hypothetical protein [Rubidibacter lacunae]